MIALRIVFSSILHSSFSSSISCRSSSMSCSTSLITLPSVCTSGVKNLSRNASSYCSLSILFMSFWASALPYMSPSYTKREITGDRICWSLSAWSASIVLRTSMSKRAAVSLVIVALPASTFSTKTWRSFLAPPSSIVSSPDDCASPSCIVARRLWVCGISWWLHLVRQHWAAA